jgi:hypothetical protein
MREGLKNKLDKYALLSDWMRIGNLSALRAGRFGMTSNLIRARFVLKLNFSQLRGEYTH